MPPPDFVQGRGERGNVEPPAQAQRYRNVVQSGARLQLFQKPEALLREGERVSVHFSAPRNQGTLHGFAPFTAEALREKGALFRRQAAQKFRELFRCGVFVFHVGRALALKRLGRMESESAGESPG